MFQVATDLKNKKDHGLHRSLDGSLLLVNSIYCKAITLQVPFGQWKPFKKIRPKYLGSKKQASLRQGFKSKRRAIRQELISLLTTEQMKCVNKEHLAFLMISITLEPTFYQPTYKKSTFKVLNKRTRKHSRGQEPMPTIIMMGLTIKY